MKKYSYKLPEDYPMYDMCYCIAKCKTPCARKKPCVGICTASDFTNSCKELKRIKNNYV